MSRSLKQLRRPVVLVTAGLLVGLVAAGVGPGLGQRVSGGTSEDTMAAVAPMAADGAADGAVDLQRSAVGFGGGATAAMADSEAAPADVDAAAAGRSQVRTAGQTLQVDDVRVAAARIRTLTTGLGGRVAAEQISLADGPSSLTLRVPETSLDEALNRFAALGRERDRATTAEDVTATLADLDSRLATQKRAISRLRELLEKAESLKDVVLLEGELSRREEELEAAQARQRALADQVALATVSVTLITSDAPLPSDDDGFVAGLRAGWAALGDSTTAVLTAGGAALPFLLLLGVLALPAGWVLRRRRRALPAG